MFLVIKMPSRFGVYEFESPDGRWIVGEYPHKPINDSEDGGGKNIYRNTVYRVQEEAAARATASRIAEENPGCEVYVCPASFVLQSAKPEVIEKKITEQGVLPV